MEREKTDRVNGTPLEAQQHLFALRDPATGNVRAIRDMTDEELVRHKATCVQEIAQQQAQMAQAMMQAAMQAAHGMVQLKTLVAVINYEAHRRSVSIVVPHQNSMSMR